MNAHTERLECTGPAGRIQVLRDQPEGTPRGVAVISHPHPLFGGTMDNKVVQTLARAFVQCGWTAVRFNFRGVGATQGSFDEGRGESEDFLQVVRELAPQGPLALAGFSFGAFVVAQALQPQVRLIDDALRDLDAGDVEPLVAKEGGVAAISERHVQHLVARARLVELQAGIGR